MYFKFACKYHYYSAKGIQAISDCFIQWAMQVLPLCRQLPHLLVTEPLNVLTMEISTPTSVRPLMAGHSGDMRECLRSVLTASMAVCVILDGMKQLPRPYAVIDLVPALVCYLSTYYIYMITTTELDHAWMLFAIC